MKVSSCIVGKKKVLSFCSKLTVRVFSDGDLGLPHDARVLELAGISGMSDSALLEGCASLKSDSCLSEEVVKVMLMGRLVIFGHSIVNGKPEVKVTSPRRRNW
jgi:hypothetical protein